MQWDIAYLPQQLQDIVDVIGLPATQRLVQSYGGLRIRVPEKMHENHPLARLLGLEAAMTLSKHYAGERLDVPRAYWAMLEIRNRQIRAAHIDGQSVRNLALINGLTERQIWNILSNLPMDTGQADLFDDE